MKRRAKTYLFVATAASIAVTLTSAIPAQAGHGCHRSGRSYHQYRSTYHRPVYPQHAIVHPQPVTPQVVTPQRVQPVQPQFGQPQFGQPQFGSNQPTPSGRPTLTPGSPGATNQAPANPQRATSQPINSLPVTSQAVTSQAVASQPAAATRAAGDSSEASALAMLASLSSNPTPATQPAAEIPQFAASTTPPAGDHIGAWTAKLPGNQSVTLTLNADGAFIWTVAKQGKSNTFRGQFRLEQGQLTLVRSNDLQQMKGSWTGSGDSFNFKLDGATTGGLAFTRG